MLAFVGRLLWGTSKLAVKYIVVPAVVAVGVAAAADALARKIRAHTPHPAEEEGDSPLPMGADGAPAFS